MNIVIKKGKSYAQFIRAMDAAPDAIADAIDDGLEKGLQAASSEVSIAIQHGSYGINTRTGTLARSITSWPDLLRFKGYVGVKEGSHADKYAWLLTDKQMTITPKSGKFLVIPTEDNKTNAGVARYTSPRQVPDGFFFKGKSGGLFFGIAEGDEVKTLFTLVPSVFIQGTGLLPDVMKQQAPKIKAKIIGKINRTIERLKLGK